MRILIVGGAGYIGGALTDILMHSKHTVRVYDCLLYEESYRKDVDFFYGDVRDRENLKKQLKWCNVVIWLAALVGDSACALNPEATFEINEKSVQWFANHFDKRIIFTSTCSVYGAQNKLLDESSPTKPISVYASSKLTAEEHLQKSNAIIFRLGTLFGIGDNFSRIRLDLVVNTLTVRAFKDKKLKVFVGEQYRPVLHVKDAAQMIANSLQDKQIGVFNLHKENIKIINLAKKVKKHFPDLTLQTQDLTLEDSRNYRVKSDKAKKLLSFKPSYSIDDGIREIKQLLKEDRIKDVNNYRYTNGLFLSMFNTHLLRK